MRCGSAAPSSITPCRRFVTDVANRGLQNNILLVITGEFGRTPRVNSNAGRDHWAPLSTLALSGGGLKMGQVVGESSSRAEVPKSRPISPQDLMATVFHVLGIPQNLHFNDPTRPARRRWSMAAGRSPNWCNINNQLRLAFEPPGER